MLKAMSKSKKKILIVEDQKIIALDLKKMLVDRGYCITGIYDKGEDAVIAVPAQQPDLILMDIMLKGKLNGIETAESIIEKYKVPIIYLTALTDVDTYFKALTTDPKKYIMKPFEMESLERAIEEVLRM